MQFNDIALTKAENRAADRLAGLLVRDEPALQASLDFGPFVVQGEGGGPRILIGDQSEIPLLSHPAPQVLDHRMALLARDGDVVVLNTPDPAFFHYIHTVLNRPQVSSLATGEDPRDPMARLCHRDPGLRACLGNLVTKAGGATVQPYLTTGNAWQLARVLGEDCGRRVYVAGPGPRIARRANDKLWFTTLAARILGTSHVPPTMHAYGPAAAAGLVRKLARSNPQVVLKIPDSAGSAGNIRLDGARLADVPLNQTARFLRRRLAARGWQGRYPLLVGVWDSNVICSPSVQMWLPLPDSGQPLVEGIFEQHVKGLNAEFAGAARSILPDDVQSRLAHEALRIAAVLQRVGYYGRCSLDAVLVRGASGDVYPHWIECNGRWGGVSIPMSAAAALSGGSLPEGLEILQAGVGSRPLSTENVLAALDALLLRPRATAEGIVLVAPPRPGPNPHLALMAIAPAQDRAEQLMETALLRLQV